MLLACLAQAGCQNEAEPTIAGVWSTTTTAIMNPGWTTEELFSGNLTPESYAYIRELLQPEYDHMSAAEIRSAVIDHNREIIRDHMSDYGREYADSFDLANDPAIQCEYFGAVRTILHNDPILIEQFDDRIEIKGEDMSSDRVIYIDGRGHPDDGEQTTLGYSIGWYEGRTLVVETVNIRANIAEDNLPIYNADDARTIERYSLSEDGKRLRMQLTVIDPVMFREPLVLESVRLSTPDVEILDAPCESISGQR
jgi:hypothetical protein